jgi:hypothetical protein
LIVWAVALLTAVATVTPAVAAPPAELQVTVEADGGMWANSDGDAIEFHVTVTNRTRGTVSGITLTFPGNVQIWIGALGKRQKWEGGLSYTVDATVDFEGLTPATQAQVLVGTAVALSADGQTEGTADVVMTAYPVLPCDQASPGDPFTFTTTEEYSVCAFEGTDYWTMTTTLPKPKRGKGPISPAATVRDGVPGNWCNHDEDGELPQEVSPDGTVVTDRQYFPADGICLHGGAGGDTFPVRNSDTFYLATWEGNTVVAEPSSAGG